MEDTKNIRFGLPTFIENSKLRLLMGTLLYLAQGLPQGVLFYAIPSWLAVSGQSAGVVGSVVAAVTLPWSLKFFLGAIVDRYTFLPMGRRRIWLIGAQACIVLVFILFAIYSPSPDEIWIVVAFVFTLSSFTALQDVALDAMVIDLTPDDERGKINGFMIAGKLVGIAGGTAVTAFFIEYYDFATAMLVAMILFAIPAVSAILIRERPCERYLPWTQGNASQESIDIKPNAWIPLLRDSLSSLLRRDPILVIVLSILYGVHQGIADASAPLFAANELGWGETRFSAMIGSVNIASAVIALSIGGWATDKFGPGKIALWSAGMASISLAVLIAMEQYWQNGTFYTIWYFSFHIIVVFFYLCMLTLGMRVCDAHVAATTFTLITASMAIGMAIGASSLGWLEQIGGFHAMFSAALITIFLSGSVTFGLSRKAGGPAIKETASSASEDEPRFFELHERTQE